jgi:hypothetical protein
MPPGGCDVIFAALDLCNDKIMTLLQVWRAVTVTVPCRSPEQSTHTGPGMVIARVGLLA